MRGSRGYLWQLEWPLEGCVPPAAQKMTDWTGHLLAHGSYLQGIFYQLHYSAMQYSLMRLLLTESLVQWRAKVSQFRSAEENYNTLQYVPVWWQILESTPPPRDTHQFITLVNDSLLWNLNYHQLRLPTAITQLPGLFCTYPQSFLPNRNSGDVQLSSSFSLELMRIMGRMNLFFLSRKNTSDTILMFLKQTFSLVHWITITVMLYFQVAFRDLFDNVFLRIEIHTCWPTCC